MTKQTVDLNNPILRTETMEHFVLTLNRLIERVEELECKLQDSQTPQL
jgi:hypothetical protein